MKDDKAIALHTAHPPAISAEQAASARQISGQPAPMIRPPLSIIEIVVKRKWTMFFCLILAIALGVAYQTYIPPKYESNAEIFIQQTVADASSSPLSASGMSVGAPSTHAALLLSTPVLQRALADPAIVNAQALAQQQDPIAYLRKKLHLVVSDELETIRISFKCADAHEASEIVRAVVMAYFKEQGLPVRGIGDPPAASESEGADPLQEQIVAARVLIVAEQLAQSQLQAKDAADRMRHAESAGDDITLLGQLLIQAGADFQAIGLTRLYALEAQRIRLEERYNGLPASWGDDHPARVPVINQIDDIELEYLKSKDEIVRQANHTLHQNHELAEVKSDRLAVELASLQQQAAVVRPVPVRLIDPPRVAIKKSSPIATQTYGIAVFLGIALGTLLSLRAEIRQSSISSPNLNTPQAWIVSSELKKLDVNSQDDLDRIEPLASVPLLGMVPALPTGRRITSPKFNSTASSIHQIRAVLQIQSNATGTKSYAFTSSRRGAGKTSVAIGVGSSLAVSGTKTLVVDCDLAGRITRGQTGRPANPNDMDPFGPIDRKGSSPNNLSLDDIAVGQGYIDPPKESGLQSLSALNRIGVPGMLDGRPLEDCVIQASVPGLTLLPAAQAETYHVGKMSDAFIRDLLDQARDKYDLIIFDTGPVPGSVEALLVTSQVDGVVVVVPHGENGQTLSRTMSYLKVVGASIVGTVFNKAQESTESVNGNRNGSIGDADNDPELGDTYSDQIDLAQDMRKDIDQAMDDMPLGSGILAAAVFAEEDSGFANDKWDLKATSEYGGETEVDNEDKHKKAQQYDLEVGENINDILPPE